MSLRIFFGSALEDFSLDGSTTYLCRRILPFFSLSYILVTWSCGTKVQLRAQLSGGRERAASLGAAFLETQDLDVERAPGPSGECGLSNRESVTGSWLVTPELLIVRIVSFET